ncbi:MAG: hypothetical protein SGJ27_09130 [Candidatus Melainabacteria bacterium]|nr:hypothetical protein [Candidatus Melainabacteria bacterium]
MTVAAKDATTQQAIVTEVQRTREPRSVSETVQFAPIRNPIESYVFAITGSAGANRPVISDENLIHNQRQELALAAEVTLKTVQYFMADHPDPFDAPVKELTELSNYLNAGMSLPYAARVDFGPYNNYATPQPDVIFPPRKGGSYRLEKGKLMIADTQGGFVPMTTLIACLRQH